MEQASQTKSKSNNTNICRRRRRQPGAARTSQGTWPRRGRGGESTNRKDGGSAGRDPDLKIAIIHDPTFLRTFSGPSTDSDQYYKFGEQ